MTDQTLFTFDEEEYSYRRSRQTPKTKVFKQKPCFGKIGGLQPTTTGSVPGLRVSKRVLREIIPSIINPSPQTKKPMARSDKWFKRFLSFATAVKQDCLMLILRTFRRLRKPDMHQPKGFRLRRPSLDSVFIFLDDV